MGPVQLDGLAAPLNWTALPVVAVAGAAALQARVHATPPTATET